MDFSEHKTPRNLMVHHHLSYLLVFYLFVSGVYIILQTRPSACVDMFCFYTHTVDDLKGSDAEGDRTAKWKWWFSFRWYAGDCVDHQMTLNGSFNSLTRTSNQYRSLLIDTPINMSSFAKMSILKCVQQPTVLKCFRYGFPFLFLLTFQWPPSGHGSRAVWRPPLRSPRAWCCRSAWHLMLGDDDKSLRY